MSTLTRRIIPTKLWEKRWALRIKSHLVLLRLISSIRWRSNFVVTNTFFFAFIRTRVLCLNEFLEYLDLISIGSLSHCLIELGMVDLETLLDIV
jgi:hypothetical protein